MTPQFDLENERALIVAALKDSQARMKIIGSVSPRDFLGKRHESIFSAIVECHREGIQIDSSAIAVHAVDDYGGHDFINRLLGMQVSTNVEFHIQRLRRDSARSYVEKVELPALAQMLIDKSVEHSHCIRKIAEIRDRMQIDLEKNVPMSELWNQEFDVRCEGESSFQQTGITTLDDMLVEGLSRQTVSIIAARTGNGKTSLIVDVVRRIMSAQGTPKILMLPLEIGPMRFLDKLVSSETMISTNRLLKDPKELSEDERSELKAAIEKLAGEESTLKVFPNPFFNMVNRSNERALDKLEEILAEGSYDLVFLDLFQRMLTDIRPAQIESALVRVQHLAKLYDVHFCLAHQVSRRAEEKKDRRPALEDLKGSGGYEEIPDLILLLHRPKAYKQFRRRDEIEIFIAKQRNGEAVRTVVADFYPSVCRLDKDRIPALKKSKEVEDETESDVRKEKTFY